MRKRTLLVIAGAMLVLVAPACTKEVTSSAEYEHFETLEDMWRRANLVIEGRLGADPEVLVLAGNDYPHTMHDVEVLRTWKGDAEPGETIQVKEEVSVSYRGVRYRVEDEAPLTPGETYLLFLDDFPCYEGETPAALVNPREGQYLLRNGEPVASELNSFEVTEPDLERAAQDASLADARWSTC